MPVCLRLLPLRAGLWQQRHPGVLAGWLTDSGLLLSLADRVRGSCGWSPLVWPMKRMTQSYRR